MAIFVTKYIVMLNFGGLMGFYEYGAQLPLKHNSLHRNSTRSLFNCSIIL